MDCCCYINFELSAAPDREWIPMGLRESVCTLRARDPERYALRLAQAGVEIEPGEIRCLHNLDASWPSCPLFAPRRRKDRARAAR